jgi:ribonuclease R
MKQFEGQAFDGIISNVTAFGLFVELENTAEGLVRMDDLNDDVYVYHEKRYLLTGTRTNKTFGIGDAIQVILARVNIEARQMDFVPVHPKTKRPPRIKPRTV